jgi:hypothetical protein
MIIRCRKSRYGLAEWRRTVWWRRTRYGMAAEVDMITRRRKTRYGGFSNKVFPYPISFAERRLDPFVRSTPPLVGTQLSIGCLKKCAKGYRNGTPVV